MFRLSLLLLFIMPLAALAQDEKPEFERVLDRKYECHDKYSDDHKPYVFVETFIVSAEDVPDEITEGVSDKEVAELSELLSKVRFSAVTISGTEFGGIAYQDGLDYRIDFSQVSESDDSYDKLEYSLVIRADGDAAFYDFSDVESGEKVSPNRFLICKKTN